VVASVSGSMQASATKEVAEQKGRCNELGLFYTDDSWRKTSASLCSATKRRLTMVQRSEEPRVVKAVLSHVSIVKYNVTSTHGCIDLWDLLCNTNVLHNSVLQSLQLGER
jgi:hypothetical protein